MKQALFWDFGDVLVFYDHLRGCNSLAQYADASAEQIYDVVFGSKLEELHYNRGEYTDEQWYQELTKRLKLRDCSYEQFAEAWGDIFSPNPHIGSVLDAVRPSIVQYIISNTNGLHFAWAVKNLPVLANHFSSPDQAILSFAEKSRKPETRIFERGFERAGVRPEDSFFIDDKHENVEAFKRLGGKGFVYKASETPIEDLISALTAAGLLA